MPNENEQVFKVYSPMRVLYATFKIKQEAISYCYKKNENYESRNEWIVVWGDMVINNDSK